MWASSFPGTQPADEYGPLDYAITDSESLPAARRPSVLAALSNPRDLLALALLTCGAAVSIHSIAGDVHSQRFQHWQEASAALGAASFAATVAQLRTGYEVSPRPRRGVIDDAVMNAYAGTYAGCVTWLAVRASSFCPRWVEGWDGVAPWIAAGVFAFSLGAPIVTLAEADADDDDDGGDDDGISARMTRGARSLTDRENLPAVSVPSSLSDTERMRVRGLLVIGVLGCVFVPDCVAFALGSSDWWDRVAAAHPSQRILESSTALFALYATEASMVATRCANKGVAPYRVMVPAFAVVCLLLAIVPCACSLYWLGDDISFFSFYRE